MRFLLALFALLLAVPASAATVRYEFTATDAGERYFAHFNTVTSNPSAPPPLTQRELAEQVHQWKDYIGISGRNVIEFVPTTFDRWILRCVSGFLCDEKLLPSRSKRVPSEAYYQPFSFGLGGVISESFRPWEAIGVDWFYRDGQLVVDDDGTSAPVPIIGDYEYVLNAYQMSFDLTDLTVTEVPLPASGLLLLGAVATLAMRRSHRR